MKRKILFGSIGAVVFIVLASLIPLTDGLTVGHQTMETSVETELASETYPEILPYWLNNTILDGNTKVIITDDPLPPNLANIEYDYMITFEEAQSIADDARQQYIDQYGIDPCAPPSIPPRINPFPFPYAFSNGSESDIVVQQGPKGDGPHQTYGQLYACVFPAKNTRDRPNNPTYLFSQTRSGFNRFQTFSVQTYSSVYSGYWDASDVPSGSTIFTYDTDLYEDLADYWLEDAPSTFLVGWVRNAAGSRAGCGGGWSCTMKENCLVSKSILAQHEISHIFDAPDHGWSTWPPCVMSYFWYILGYTGWCSSCYNTIHDAIWL